MTEVSGGSTVRGELQGVGGGFINDIHEDALHLKSGGKTEEFLGTGRQIVPLTAGLAAPFFAN